MIIKRTFDIVGSLAGILFLSPILIILSLIIRFILGRPVIFKQNRPGYKGEIFSFYKFRTMTDEVDSKSRLLPDKDRITPFGNFLRNTSLDELPSLFNVLKGDMSLVGPRPLLVEYLEHYNPEQAHRHDVKPGITGWAQINGRNAISWDKKFELDVWYVDNGSILMDIKIILKTIVKVFKREGIDASTNHTMPKFTGKSREI